MFRITIVEDEKAQAERLEQGIRRYFDVKQTDYQLDRYPNGAELLKNYREPADLILMDIEMPEMNGLQTARELRKFDQDAVLVFVTRMAQFAIHGYEVNAMGYMLKPVTDFALNTILKKAEAVLLSRIGEKLVLQTKSGIVSFSTRDLSYIEVQGHHLTYHLTDRDYEVYGKLSEMEERLKNSHFSRCGKAFLVNLAFVREITGNELVLAGRTILPLSRSMKKNFMDDYIAYLSRKEM